MTPLKQSSYSSLGQNSIKNQSALGNGQRLTPRSQRLDQPSSISTQNRQKRYCLKSPRGFLIHLNGEVKFSLDCLSWSNCPNNATRYRTKEEAHFVLNAIKSSFHSDESHAIELIGVKEFIFLHAGDNHWFTNDN